MRYSKQYAVCSMKHTIGRLLLLTAYCLLLTASGSEAAKPRLSAAVVEGTAVVTDGDLTLAKDSAIKNAMRSAVTDVVTNFTKEVEGLETYKGSLEEKIYNNYENFIQSYKILGEMQDKDTYSVTIQVNIFEDSIKKRLLSLGIASIKHDNRKILLIIDEKTNISLAEDNFLLPFSISEDAVSKVLADTGFEIVNRTTVRNKVDLKDLKQAITGDGKIVYNIGKQFNADIVILGIAEAKTETGGVRAELNAKVYSVKKETLIVEKNEITNVLTTDKVIGIAQSLRNAADKVAPVLVDFIKKELEGENKNKKD
ncbi:MAG: flagellar assembly protein T N-terminal domain-containing protein [Nitrospinae bacterium]|nr:flagellar assembly protein T N-terminal domain-containing protein [Nitrospinota bacterium]